MAEPNWSALPAIKIHEPYPAILPDMIICEVFGKLYDCPVDVHGNVTPMWPHPKGYQAFFVGGRILTSLTTVAPRYSTTHKAHWPSVKGQIKRWTEPMPGKFNDKP